MQPPIVAPQTRNNRIFDLRPMSIGELLDRVFFFYRQNFRSLVVYSLILNIPLTVLLFGSSVITALPLINPDLMVNNPAILLSGNFILLASSLGVSVLNAFTTAVQISGMAVSVRNFILEGNKTSLREMWQASRAKIMPLIIMLLLQFVFGIVLGIVSIILFFTVVGFPFMLALVTLYSVGVILAYSSLMYEETEVTEALRRGWILIASGGGRILAFLFVFYLFLTVMGGTMGGILGVLGGIGTAVTENPLFILVMQPIANFLLVVLVNPLVYAGIAILYFDLRIRNEGLDVALIAQASAGEPLNLVTAPRSVETVMGTTPRRTVLTLAGLYTLVILGIGGIIAALIIVFGVLL